MSERMAMISDGTACVVTPGGQGIRLDLERDEVGTIGRVSLTAERPLKVSVHEDQGPVDLALALGLGTLREARGRPMGDDLRDRIAGVLDENFNPDQYPIMAAMFRDYAQAVIDDLGLTVETRIDVPGRRGINPVSRVVGEWER